MDDSILAIVAFAVAALIVIALAWFLWTRTRSRRLKESFGPEYDRVVSKSGRSEGEKRLDERRKRVEKYDLHPLPADDRVRFVRRWDEVQARFVDDPEAAVADAQNLVDEVMGARGYPVGDIQRQQEDVSVENPGVVNHYRRAREIARRNDAGEASTEDLRLAMQHYRTLFESLLEGGSERAEKRSKKEAHVR
jgi:hypothetical protein